MKNILILTLIFLVVMICFQFIVIEADACSVEEAAVTAAQAAYDEAVEVVRGIEEEAARVAIRLRHPLKGDTTDIVRAIELEQEWKEAGIDAQRAYDALVLAKSALELCQLKKSELLGCGHSISSGHTRHQYSCGHFDYSCQEAKHQLRTCPTGSEGQSCEYSSYRLCSEHAHAYSSDSSSGSQSPSQPTPVPTPPSNPSPPTPVGACGHAYDPGSSSAYSHRSVDCPTDNGRSCQYGSYYACTPHTHAYPSPPQPVVRCPAHSWTSCGGTSSHATTCAAGHTYYTCNSSAVSTHSSHTAPEPDPPPPPTSPPPPPPPPPPNDDDDEDDDTGDTDEVVCPANGWTGCGGTSSHETTCGRGHTYYTCNSSASAYHSGH